MIFILSLSFLNMMFISGVLAGIWESELNAMISFAVGHITVNPQQQPTMKQYISNQDTIRANIRTIPGIVAMVRHYHMAGSLSYDKDKNGQLRSISGVILGIDPAEEQKMFITQNIMLSGTRLSPEDTDQIVLSSAVAGGYGAIERLGSDLGGARVGDKIQATYSNGIIRTYTIKGIYDDALGINQTFITAKEAESILSISNSASQIMVKVDLARAPLSSYEEKIQAMMPNLSVKNYTSGLGSVASFQQALDMISGIVGAISVLVAAITIFVLIYVNALNKQRQIGILKAIGIKQNIIVNAYIIQSLFYTICGISIGAAVVFGFLNPLLRAHPVPLIKGVMNLMLAFTSRGIFVGILSFAVAGFLAGLIPSRMVAKKDILKAIWG